MNNMEDAKTTLIGNCKNGVTSSSLKGYYSKLHLWVNKNGMANLLSIPCLEEGDPISKACVYFERDQFPLGCCYNPPIFTGLLNEIPPSSRQGIDSKFDIQFLLTHIWNLL